MSVRRIGQGHSIPDNATWIEFPRSDGDPSKWPVDTQRVVDREGHVNYYRPVPLDENPSIHWRLTVGAKVAQALKLPEGPKYVLKSFPEGYQMYDHNKGPAANPRHDPYLIGSVTANRFRSANEFIPHAVWLIQDTTMDRANCGCRYCTKKPQKQISDAMGLSKRTSSTPTPSAGGRVQRQREPRPREVKPYTSVRRAPKPVKKAIGPKQALVSDRNADIRDVVTKFEVKSTRYYRKGELVWCALSPGIAGKSEEGSIVFWPGLVEDVNLKSEPMPRQPGEPHDRDDVRMASPDKADESISAAGKASSSSITNDAAGKSAEITWTVRQWTVYKMKLLATSHTCLITDDEVLPYLAYAPSRELIDAVREELSSGMQTAADSEMESDMEKMYDFDPYSPQPDSDPTESSTIFQHAVAPFTLATQIASVLAGFWTPTDEWDAKFSYPPTPNSNPTPREDANASLHSVITAAMVNNSQPVSEEQVQDQTSRMLGPRPPTQSVSQLRYQGLWWGAERIWTDELVRIKLARCQFAPQGAQMVYPPSGPSASTIEHNAGEEALHSVSREDQGAAGKGMFMKLEGLFVVDVPKADGTGMTKECRASGMLYELADDEWEEPANAAKVEANGKGKEPAIDHYPPSGGITPPDIGIGNLSISNSLPLPRTTNGPSSIHGPSPLAQATQTKTDSADASSSQTPPTAPSPSSRNVDSQLSHPVLSTPYPLPTPPRGFKFRPILPPGHEVVLSISLISGRYYPGLFDHRLLQNTLQKALHVPAEEGGLLANRQLWAMEGHVPGVYQSMDPVYWRNSRHTMLTEADAEARSRLVAFWEDLKKSGSQDADKVEPVDTDMEDLFGPEPSSISTA